MNVLDKHYLDRDLNRSGNSVVMITAGPGVFNVDGKLSGKGVGARPFLPPGSSLPPPPPQGARVVAE